MAKGDSGRIVIEVNPGLKRQLYSVLAIESRTLKDWFIGSANHYLNGQKKSAIPAARKTKQKSRRQKP